jgi:5-(carboxyamino)imidazole ribonucleotide synthase
VSEGRLLVNELAPRPHNSGHHTLDACVTDQFEQQVRALCGLPLGEPRAHSAAVMVNLLGELWLDRGEPDWAALHGVPGLKVHLYGKRSARRGRKMGHFTVIGDDRAAVLEAAQGARAALAVGDG